MLKIALCDDTPSDLQNLRTCLNEYLEANKVNASVSEFSHPDDLLSAAETNHFNIYLLDIVMPMVNGIQTAHELRWNDKNSQIVFVTSEKSFALEAFDVNAVNYILKPINKEKLFKTLDLIRSRIVVEDSEPVTVKIKGGVKKLFLKDVAYIEYANHTVKFCLNTGAEISTVTLRINFNDYIQLNIHDDNFVRCHESFLVNLSYIDVLSKSAAELRIGKVVPVSKSRYPDIQKAYLDYQLN